ncbi:DUF4157 domain-containing protein [Streptomyces bambusae]|nr:DUF4157 domain-containing protein [Streptomyces bambusae]
MNAGPVGGTDLASLLFPQAGDASALFPEAPPAPAPATAARPEHPVGDHPARRRNLGQSRRLGLGPALSHTPHADPAALGEEDGRPPPEPAARAAAPETLPTHPTDPPGPETAPPHHHERPAAPVGPAATRPDADGTTPPHPVETGPAPSRPPLHHRATPRPPAGASTAPADLARAVSNLHGIDVTGTALHTGERATRMARDMAAKAFTKDAEVYLPDTAAALDSPRTRGLIAHELTHVAQQKRYGGNLPPENSPAGRALEAEAVSAERYFRGDPGAPAPLVHRRPVTASPDPEEIRRLVAQMTPAAPPPPPPAPEPVPEPETPAPPPVPEPSYTGPEMSWTPEGGLVDGVQRASREEVVDEYLAELNHAISRKGEQRKLTTHDLETNQEHREMIGFLMGEGKHREKATREEIILEFLADEEFKRRRSRGDAPPLSQSDILTDPDLKEALDFRIAEAIRKKRLVQGDNDDDVREDRDIHWLKGQMGLGIVQALASEVGIKLDRKRRDALRQYFGGRPPKEHAEQDADPAAEGLPVTSGALDALGPSAVPEAADGAARPLPPWARDNRPAAPAQQSLKGPAEDNGASAPAPTAGRKDRPLPPWARTASAPAVAEYGDEDEDPGTTPGSGLDVWNEVKNALRAAARSEFLPPSDKKAEPDKKKDAEDGGGTPPALAVDALGDDQVNDLAQRLYPKVRDMWNSEQHLRSAVKQERYGYRY